MMRVREVIDGYEMNKRPNGKGKDCSWGESTKAAADAHTDAHEGFQAGRAVDDQVFVPLDDALLEQYDNSRATWKDHLK